jgi:phosphatidylserine/phosphatidylglycerophosphate/cardiolipin synthase-like enzyme
MADLGIHCRTDDAPSYHMHDKFMIVDGKFVMTGSFNWTYQAGSHNQENLLVVDHPFYIERYTMEFEKLWKAFEAKEVRTHGKVVAPPAKIKAKYNNAAPVHQSTSDGWGL